MTMGGDPMDSGNGEQAEDERTGPFGRISRASGSLSVSVSVASLASLTIATGRVTACTR